MAQLDKSTLSTNIDGVHTTSLTSSYWGNTTNGGITGTTHANVLNLLIAQLQNMLDSTVNLSDDVISQVDAEAGTATVPKLWTAERVNQAIAALGAAGDSVSFVDNSDGTFTITINGTPTNFDSNQAQAPQASTLPIQFDILGVREYGTPAAPITGALTFDMTGAVDGGKAVVWYQDASDPFNPYPTVSGNQIRKFGGEAFGTNLLMRYEFEYDLGTTTIAVKPFRQDTSPPTLSGLAVSNSAPPTNGTNMTLTYTYAQAESVAENTSAALFEWWEADTAGELDEADIVAGTPTLVKSATGDATYNPSTDGKYVRGRVRAFTTDSSASGSDWYYTDVLGPVVAASGFTPLSNTSTLGWWDGSDAAGGTVGVTPNQWEIFINKADGTGETNFSQTSSVNQGNVANQGTDFSLAMTANSRYENTSWTRATPLVAAGADVTIYLQVKFPASVSSPAIWFYLGNQPGRYRTDASNGYVEFASVALRTAAGSVVGDTWHTIKLRWDSTAVLASIEVIDNEGVTPNSDTHGSTAVGPGNEIGTGSNQFEPNGECEIRHMVICDGTLQTTGTEEADLETWLTAQAAL